MIMTSREFNQNTSLAQKYAQTAPVIITNRGKPAYVPVKYEEFQNAKPIKSALEALTPPPEIAEALAQIDFETPPRSTKRRLVDFGKM